MKKAFISLLFVCLMGLAACIGTGRQITPLHPQPSEYLKEIEEFRASKDTAFKSDRSPLAADSRKNFQGLPYFPIDPAFRLTGTLEKFAAPEVRIEKNDPSGMAPMNAVGLIQFSFQGAGRSLEVWQSPGGQELIVLFKDKTNGGETYEAGRYVDLQESENGVYILDFNLASNPYCCYSHDFLCPLPPPRNSLDIRVMAGEKKLFPFPDQK